MEINIEEDANAVKTGRGFADYLSAVKNGDHRARMREILDWVEGRFPELKSKIAWNQPVFTDHGTFIIGFSMSKQHISVAPEPAAIKKFSEEIAAAGYGCSLNIFRIRWEEQVDFLLLERIIQYNRKDKADCKSFWRKQPRPG